jgi:hypothetical protein
VGDWVIGCMDETACNYILEANTANENCTYAQDGYDCDGNINVQIGDEVFGGIVFYIDSTGEHGLVASLEDLGQYQWGCVGINISGSDGQEIGTGQQNTMDIVNQGCVTENAGITAAQAALNYEINGYNDWFLPSIDELALIYNNVAMGALNNLTNYSVGAYISSSELNTTFADGMNFWTEDIDNNDHNGAHAGNVGPSFKEGFYFICAIRAF